MSIAIAAVVNPSRLLRCCLKLFSLLVALLGVYIGCQTELAIFFRCGLIALCCLTLWRGFLYHQKIANIRWRIAIDGQGQLRCQPVSPGEASANHSSQNRLFNLTTGTTVWPHGLFLRLQSQEDDVNINLVILSDSLSKEEFRRLSVACKWILTHAGLR